jgi:hypothetical protein
MEFTVKTPAGKIQKHFIDPRTGTAHKVLINNKEDERKQ